MKLIITTIENCPKDFIILAQNTDNFELCGYTNQDGYEEIEDIPIGYSQRVVSGAFGDYLTLKEINNLLLIKNTDLKEENKGLTRNILDLQDYILQLEYEKAQQGELS